MRLTVLGNRALRKIFDPKGGQNKSWLKKTSL
jgi:hypothetical protein